VLGRKSILIVDDDQGILKSFKEILEPEGYSVDTAETAVDAVDKCRTHPYNLAIIDIKLRDAEGTELLARVHEILPRARKIMITGYPSLDNAVDSVNLQADAYIIKPVNPETFLRVVAENMNKQLEAEKMTEEKVVGWVESRYEETRRNRSKRKLLAPEQLPNAEE
jgi:two-component system, NtrC family, response regulator AlgB